jgi:hypothetical protein
LQRADFTRSCIIPSSKKQHKDLKKADAICGQLFFLG